MSDFAIRVTVTPSQSSYFAGEQFSATITFKNTRTTTVSNNIDAKNGSRTAKLRSASQTHKRSAHSVSSAPLPRPPTSPGIPRTSVLATEVSHSPVPGLSQTVGDGDRSLTRKGLVGDDIDALPQLNTDRIKAKHAAARSLSVTVSSQELAEVSSKSASLATRSFREEQQLLKSPHSPRVPSTLSRLSVLPLLPDHPHARKNSVVDGSPSTQFQLQDTTKVSLHSPYNANATSSSSTNGSASTSTFSLALDPIAETSSSSATSPLAGHGLLQSPFPDSAVDSPSEPFAYPPRPTANHSSSFSVPPSPSASRHSQPHPRTGRQPQRSQSAVFSSPQQSQDTELILYAYAHLVGNLTLSTSYPPSNASSGETRVRSLLLGSTGAVGGGSMDITPSVMNSSSQNAHRRRTSVQMMNLTAPSSSSSPSTSNVGNGAARGPIGRINRTHGRSTSFGAGLLSLLSSSGSKSIPPSTSDPGDGSGTSNSFGKQTQQQQRIDPDLPLPTLETQPVMLVVDLALAPGEERSYMYTFTLPPNLPPTFRGSNLRFSYELIVGTCRGGDSTSVPSVSPRNDVTNGAAAGAPKGTGISRVMKMPVRVYNNVSVRIKQMPYDLLWPIARRKENVNMELRSGKVEEIMLSESRNGILEKRAGLQASSAIVSSSATTLEDIKNYAKVLLGDSGNRPRIQGTNGEDNDDDEYDNDPLRRRGEEDEQAENAMSGCREAVEILTRISKKVSYDVNKDGVKVAVLTFSKSAYRLGESMLGVVEVNERWGRGRVLKLSAFLETQETLPSSIASSLPPSSARQSRRVHAEHHSSFLGNMLRTTFVLNIPSDGTPAFKVDVSSSSPETRHLPSHKAGGFEWKVRLCLLVAVAKEDADPGTEGVMTKAMVRDGPRGEWGSTWKATSGIAPLECLPPAVPPKPAANEVPKALASTTSSWTAFFTASLLGNASEREYHDGDVLEDEDDGDTFRGEDSSGEGGYDDGLYDGIKPNLAGGVGEAVNFGGRNEVRGWKEVKMETVECEVPVGVWPGNTAYKAMDVVFEV